MDLESLPLELRELVKWSVALWGEVLKKELGERLFDLIESLRQEMAGLRGQDDEAKITVLRRALEGLRRLSPRERREVASAYALMLEVMNACENAHRSHRLGQSGRLARVLPGGPEFITYVLTAHPTEARAPDNIALFREIQKQLQARLENPRSPDDELRHLLFLAWRAPLVRDRAPKVRDEAEHIYSTLFQDEILQSFLELNREGMTLFFRSWVGGDKDGHPGVDETTLEESLKLSREFLHDFAQRRQAEVGRDLARLSEPVLRSEMKALEKALAAVKNLRPGDGARVLSFHQALKKASQAYAAKIGALHPALSELERLLHIFPGLVLPLELREASDVLMGEGKNLAIDRMLQRLAVLSRGANPRWYARGFIVSMCQSIAHLRAASARVERVFKSTPLPIIPLFEQRKALEDSAQIAEAYLRDPILGRALRRDWGGRLELMVGYSDSAKEVGVLPSRLEIATAMHGLEKACTAQGVEPTFFQGSGGSVDRGGGSVGEQTAWWPRSALRRYKVTVQGEMVERSLASPEIARGQLLRIQESALRSLKEQPAPPHSQALQSFANRVAESYQGILREPDFLRVVEEATPYKFLSVLKIGSRPAKRAAELSLASLRAIPWVLCWTQSRVLLPTWWGVGSAWAASSPLERRELKRAFAEEPVFSSFLKALGFTLAKVELAPWRLYLENSGLKPALQEEVWQRFAREHQGAWAFLREVTGESDPLWFRPWLGVSIQLRSPMIHPLNLLQLVALEEGDRHLFRLTVTGISSGMLTTG